MVKNYYLYKTIVLLACAVFMLSVLLFQEESITLRHYQPNEIDHYTPGTAESADNIDSSSPSGDSEPKARQLSLSDLDLRFNPNTSKSCKDGCHRQNTLCHARTFDMWQDVFTNGTVKGDPLFKPHEFVFPWEKFYLSQAPLTDMKYLPNYEMSRVWYLRGGKTAVYERKVVAKRNRRLSFRVDLVDSFGNLRHLGGDELRVWISYANESLGNEKGHSASGFVEDMGNGSYKAVVTTVWPGLIQLNIGVVYPREYIRTALHHSRVGSHRFIFGLFERKEIKEVTVCHATPNVPGRSCVCNFTSWNKAPFYCGRPLDGRLSCQDWQSVWPASKPPFTDFSPAERVMAATMSRPATNALIKHGILIDVPENDIPTLPRCTDIDSSVTWSRQPPRGFWSLGPSWTSLMCLEPEATSRWFKNCLENSQVWLIGDSNIVRIRLALCDIINCVYVPGYTKWPSSLLGRNEEYNISVIFRPHEHPLYLRPEWMSLYLNGGIGEYLNSIPSTGQHFVIVHYYLHLASSHLSALYSRLVIMKDALLTLLKRNPDTVVGVRGPHISGVQWEYNHMFGGDVLAGFILRLYHEVLGSLKRRVIFLDGWDMSISIRNERMHPSRSIPYSMLRTLMAFKCP